MQNGSFIENQYSGDYPGKMQEAVLSMFGIDHDKMTDDEQKILPKKFADSRAIEKCPLSFLHKRK